MMHARNIKCRKMLPLKAILTFILLSSGLPHVVLADLSDISMHTESWYMTGGLGDPPPFGWTPSFDIGFTQATGTFNIELKIDLVGDDPGDAIRNTWEQGIEDIWSNKFYIMEDGGQFFYKILVDAQFVDTGANHTVTVTDGYGRSNMTHWYTSSSWPADHLDETAAHEAGHMFGNYDEYTGGGVNPDGTFGNEYDNIMGYAHQHGLHARHFQFVVDVASAYAPGDSFAAVVVPVPGAVLLGMLGLSVVGVKLRKHA